MTDVTTLAQRLAQTIQKRRLFVPGDTLIVALSGGADSSALLDLLSRLAGYNLNLIVVHLNHCLRGADSDGDEEFCCKLAARYSIPFETRRIDIRSVADENRLNLEDAARRARIEFLDEMKEKYRAAAVVIAHHADDQAETVLMRLLRGSGMTGLSGMAYRNEREYVRPLLDITRCEIELYLRHYALEWREDASNSDTIYLRNRIRHELLPLLEEYNPAVRSCLAATAAIISADEELLSELTAEAFAESCVASERKIVCSRAKLTAFKPALRQRVLRHAFKQLTGTLTGVSRCHISAVCDLIDSDRPNSRLALPHEVTALREYDHLSLITGAAVVEYDFEFMISEPGCYQLPCGGSIKLEATGTATFSEDSGTCCLDIEKAPFPWLVRTFRPGDRMVPFGMSGKKKVKNLFIDRKIPLSERKRLPLLFCGDDLIWIAGVCTSELTRITEGTHTLVKATFLRD